MCSVEDLIIGVLIIDDFIIDVLLVSLQGLLVDSRGDKACIVTGWLIWMGVINEGSVVAETYKSVLCAQHREGTGVLLDAVLKGVLVENFRG